jgi:hypothetical protein
MTPARTYDDCWHRRGRYDRDLDDTTRCHAEVNELNPVFDALSFGGDGLELALGSGK